MAVKVKVNLIITKIIVPILILLYSFYMKVIKHRFDYVKGRYTKKRIKNIGTNVKIHGSATITNPNNIKIGCHTRIGKNLYINSLGKVTIGKNCQISRNVVIYTSNHNINGSTIPYDNTYIVEDVSIGDSVWVGMGVVILPGVSIGSGAVIGMNTVVTKDIPEHAIVVGAGQRVVGSRDIVNYQQLNNEKKYFGKDFPDL